MTPVQLDPAVEALLDRLPRRRLVTAAVSARAGEQVATASRGPLPPEATAGSALFQVGSLTKTFTALLLADMVTRGEVSLDDPVARFVGDGSSDALRAVTLVDLATHTARLPSVPRNLRHRVRLNRADPYAGYGIDELTQALGAVQPKAGVGRTFRYANFGYATLGYALGRAAGVPYEELLRVRVLEPLALHRTVFDAAGEEHRVPGHARPGRVVPDWRLDAFAPAGALWSSADDILRYLDAHLHPERSPLEPAIVAVQQPHVVIRKGRLAIGLAWLLISGHGRTARWHNGGTGGFSSFAGFVTEADVAVVALANSRIAGPLTRAGLRTLEQLASPPGDVTGPQ